MIEILFRITTLEEFYRALKDNNATLNAIRIVYIQAMTYFTDDSKQWTDTRPATNEFYCVITHGGIKYTCKGMNGADTKVRISSIDEEVKS